MSPPYATISLASDRSTESPPMPRPPSLETFTLALDSLKMSLDNYDAIAYRMDIAVEVFDEFSDELKDDYPENENENGQVVEFFSEVQEEISEWKGGFDFNRSMHISAVIDLLAAQLQDVRELIKWWACENDFGRGEEAPYVYDLSDEKKISIATCRDLYDFLVCEMKGGRHDIFIPRNRYNNTPMFPKALGEPSDQMELMKHFFEHYGISEGKIADYVANYLPWDAEDMDYLFHDVLHRYEVISAVLKALGAHSVLDIGGSHGYQSRIFTQSGFNYFNLDPWGTDTPFFDDPRAVNLAGRYPNDWTGHVDAAISAFCVGSPGWFSDGYDLMQIADDFDIFVAIMPEPAFKMLEGRYDHAQILEHRLLEDYEDDDIAFCVFYNGERRNLDERSLVSAIASR